MSTRAFFTFTDADASFNVYKHHDGYPRGAADTIAVALKWFTWQLPRFEADEFAGAFCAAGKAHRMVNVIEGKRSLPEFLLEDNEYAQVMHGGGIRFMPQGKPADVIPKHCCDVEFRYEITCKSGNDLHIVAYECSGWDGKLVEKCLYVGSFKRFVDWVKKEEEKV